MKLSVKWGQPRSEEHECAAHMRTSLTVDCKMPSPQACFPNLHQVPAERSGMGSRVETWAVSGDGGEDDATSQSSAHFVSVQSQISKVRTLRGWALTQSFSLQVFVSFVSNPILLSFD